MNLYEAITLNNFCKTNKNVLLVITQANNTLSVYYKNDKGNIAHKFSSCKTGDLSPGLVWINLELYSENYKKLLFYFHPDHYKGKRQLYELQNIIGIITSIKQSKQNYKERELYEFLLSWFTESRTGEVKDLSQSSDFIRVLGSRNEYKLLHEKLEEARWMETFFEEQRPDLYRILSL